MAIQFRGSDILFDPGNQMAMDPACCCRCPPPSCTTCVPWELNRDVAESFDVAQHVIGFNPSAWTIGGVISGFLDNATCTGLKEHVQGTVLAMWNGLDDEEIKISLSTYQRPGQTPPQGLLNPGWRVAAEIRLRDGLGFPAPGSCAFPRLPNGTPFNETYEPFSMPDCINFTVAYDLTNESDPDNSDPELYLGIGDVYQQQVIDACTGHHLRPPNTDPHTRVGNDRLNTFAFKGMLMDLTVWDFRYQSVDHRNDWDDLVAGAYVSGRCSHAGGAARHNWCDSRTNWQQDQTDNCNSMLLTYNSP